jgi:hypothetical protein
LFDRPGAATEVQVAERDDILIGGIFDVAAADATEADRGDVQLLIRRNRTAGGIQPWAGHRESGGGHAGVTKERPTVELVI